MDGRTADGGFTEFYHTYLPKLTSLAKRFLREDADEVEDLLQDVWIRGSRAWPPRERKYAGSWLGAILVNEALGRKRRAKRRPLPLIARPGEEPPDPVDAAPLPDESVLRRQVRDAMTILEARAPGQVAALRLVCIEGRTYSEAGRQLGIAEGTAKSQTFKAIAQLRQSLTAPKAA